MKFLRTGRVTVVRVKQPYRVGRDYALGVKHNRPLCRVKIISCTEIKGEYAIEIMLHSERPERYLARNPAGQRRDYVEEPARAARGEGAVIDSETQARYSRQAFERDDAIRRERAARAADVPGPRYAFIPSLPRGDRG